MKDRSWKKSKKLNKKVKTKVIYSTKGNYNDFLVFLCSLLDFLLEFGLVLLLGGFWWSCRCWGRGNGGRRRGGGRGRGSDFPSHPNRQLHLRHRFGSCFPLSGAQPQTSRSFLVQTPPLQWHRGGWWSWWEIETWEIKMPACLVERSWDCGAADVCLEPVCKETNSIYISN